MRVRRRQVGEDPDYRFSLANERTFLAWIRTSLALLAGGVAILALLDDFGPSGLRRAAGLILFGLSFAVALVSYSRWAATERALRTGSSLPGPGLMRLVSGAIVVLVVIVVMLSLW